MQAPIDIPNFELLKEIGRGGMARVYLARQLQPKRKVAVKIVFPGVGQDETFLQSLKQEGDMAAQFSHENIVTVYACGVIDGHYYLAMEYLGGGDLTQKIKSGISDADAVKIIGQMASALEHAHQRNTLHRDIKPENIMFHESGKAVLVDFGIAKEQDTESNFTKAGAVVGTPHYMSPERATGKAVDARSDIYALGVVFYEMLTGKKLYEGADTFAISYAHVYEPIPKLPERFSNYQGLLNKLVAKDPDDRFQDASVVKEAFDKPIEASAAMPADAPSTQATLAVSDTELRNLRSKEKIATAPGPDAQAAEPSPAAAKSKLLLPAIGVTGLLVVVSVLVWMNKGSNAGGGSSAGFVNTEANLTVEQRLAMQDLLQSANAFVRIGNYEQAEENFVKVLEEFSCRNQEARSSLTALNAERAQQIIDQCR